MNGCMCGAARGFGAFAIVLGIATAAIAEHAKVRLEVRARDEQRVASMDQTPPAWGKNPRPVVHARAGEAVQVEYLLTNVYPHKTLTDVVVHFFVVPIGRIGQREVPEPGQDAVLQTAFDMDFRPGGHAGARTVLRLDRPGVYLIRVETGNTQSDHEHFAAIDLVVSAD